MTTALVQYGSGAVITAVLHPFGSAKILMQMGHEPLAPEVSTSVLFKSQVQYYPNIFKYISHIKQVDGFWGLYRGVFPRVIAGFMGNMVQYNIQDQFKAMRDGNEDNSLEKDFVPWIKQFAKETAEDTVGRVCGVIVSHPFHVIMVRSVVQFIGRETQYNTIISSVKEIYNTDGILGFFSGIIPRLIGEVITIWLTSFLAQCLNKYVIEEKDLKSYSGAACGLVVSHCTYSFSLVTNIMAANNCGLKGAQPPVMPVYTGWLDCMGSLARGNDLKRGASALFRPVNITKLS